MVDVDPLCRIELLGGLQVLQHERAITRFRTQKGGALLGYLAYHLDRAHPREVLIELLWPWSAPAAGRNSLSVELSALRRQLEPPGMARGSAIKADRSSVQLNPDTVSTDVADFEASLAAARRASADPERVQCLVEAVEAYGGPLLPGYYQEWILPEQERLAGLYCGAVRALTTELAAAGDHNRAIEYARKAVGAERLREEAHEQLIKVLAASGQIEAALRQYAELEQVLAEELGEEPSAAVRALAEQLAALRGRPAAAGEALAPPAVPGPAPQPTALPGGTVTLLLADAVCPGDPLGGTAEVSQEALAQLHELVGREVEHCGGQQPNQSGDSLAFVFGRPSQGLSCAIACQQALRAHAEAQGTGELRVRMALDTGEAELDGGTYRGAVVDRARGLLLAAHGGQVLCSEATASVLRTALPAGLRLVDLGHYRLRTVEAPERLFAVEYPDMTSEPSPPPNAAFAYRGNLPPQFTRFFGRGEELAELRQLLLVDDTRLVTLTGPGGSGKTRLAIETARELSDAFHGAVWFVSLQELRDAELITAAILDALGLERSPQRQPIDQACEALSRQPSLLLLDNFEHLVDEGAATVQGVLERAPTVKCLVTSRQRLDVSAERESSVDPLPTPADETGPDELVHCPSVQLFVDRAQAVRPDFQITERNAGAIAALCAHLEGIPLALELAAARSQVMTPARMLEQVESRFSFLVSRRRDVAERHRTLRAALDWSCELLRPELQRFFARLSVFRGGWGVEAAEVVCDEPRALEYLEELSECSMVLVDPAHDRSADTRFRMLETLREYGWESLSEEERQALQRRHAEHFRDFVHEMQKGWTGNQCLHLLGQDYENISGAIDWHKSQTDEADAGLALVRDMVIYWFSVGRFADGRRHTTEMLQQQGERASPRQRARALVAAGQYANLRREYASARRSYGEALWIFRCERDKAGIVGALSGLFGVEWKQRSYEEAWELAKERREVCVQLGDDAGVANACNDLGMVARAQGDLTRASRLHEEALEIARRVGLQNVRATCLTNLGVAAWLQGDYDAGERHHREALSLQQELGRMDAVAENLKCLGMIAKRRGDLDGARALLGEALAIARAREFQGIARGCEQELAAIDEGVPEVPPSRRD